MSLKDKLFGFEGRLRRQDWWLLGLATALGWGLVLVVAFFLTGPIWPGAAVC